MRAVSLVRAPPATRTISRVSRSSANHTYCCRSLLPTHNHNSSHSRVNRQSPLFCLDTVTVRADFRSSCSLSSVASVRTRPWYEQCWQEKCAQAEGCRRVLWLLPVFAVAPGWWQIAGGSSCTSISACRYERFHS